MQIYPCERPRSYPTLPIFGTGHCKPPLSLVASSHRGYIWKNPTSITWTRREEKGDLSRLLFSTQPPSPTCYPQTRLKRVPITCRSAGVPYRHQRQPSRRLRSSRFYSHRFVRQKENKALKKDQTRHPTGQQHLCTFLPRRSSATAAAPAPARETVAHPVHTMMTASPPQHI